MTVRNSFSAGWPYALILLVGVAVMLPALDSFGLWDPWEPQYARGAREMLEQRSPMTPYYVNNVMPARPLLTYWSVMTGFALFDEGGFGARIGGVLFALLAMTGVYYTVSRMRGRQAGLFSALVLGTMTQFYLLARQATPDIFFATGIGLALLFLCLGLFRADERRGLHLILSYVGFAIAVLARGPAMPALIYFSTLAIFAFSRLDLGRLREAASGVAVAAAPLGKQALWFGAIVLVLVGPSVATAFFRGEPTLEPAIERIVAPIENDGSAYFYIDTLIFGLFPWSCFIPIAVIWHVRWGAGDPFTKYGPETLLLSAAAVIFTARTIAESKFPHHLAPILLPLAVLIGMTLDGLLRHPNDARTRLAQVLAAMLFLPAMLDIKREDGAEHLLGAFTIENDIAETYVPGGYLTLLLGAMTLALLVAIVVRSRVVVGAMLLFSALFAGYTSAVIVPALSRDKSFRGMCETWREAGEPQGVVGYHGDVVHSVFFYCGRARFMDSSRLVEFMDPAEISYAIVDRRTLKHLRTRYAETYPGREFRMVDETHPDFALIATD